MTARGSLTTRPAGRRAGLPALGMAALLVTGCSSGDQSRASSSSTGATDSSTTTGTSSQAAEQTTTPQEDAVQITLDLDGRSVIATLADNPTAEAFADLLPLTLSVRDFNGTEKIADLPAELTTEGAPDGFTPTAGDLALYAPWGNLAVYYQDYSYSSGLVLLGRLDDGPAAIADLPDDTAVEITLLG